MRQMNHGWAIRTVFLLFGAGLCIACGNGQKGEGKAPMMGDFFAPETEITSFLGKKLLSPPAGEQAEKNLEEAKLRYAADPSEDNTIWLGRRAAYAGLYQAAVRIFSEGLERFPDSYRLLRHRGHRFITLREFEKAAADLKKAADLVAGRPRETEPDGAPNSLNIPLSNTQFNIWYHLGLSYYLLGRYEEALAAYRECLAWNDNPDLVVATTDWMVMTLWRLDRSQEAEQLLAGIAEGMSLVENDSYYERLLMYKGLRTPEQVLEARGDAGDAGTDPNVTLATQGYGVGNWYRHMGDTEKALQVLEKVVAGESWAAFGFIAAEADLASWKK